MKEPRINPPLSLSTTLALLLCATFGWAQVSAMKLQAETSAAKLTIETLYGGDDFDADSAPQIQWATKGNQYVVLESSGEGGDQELAIYNVENGRREVLVASGSFYPGGSDKPLEIESYQLDYEKSQLLLFTDAERVWRRRTRGNYWFMDLGSGSLIRLGGDAPSASLMFAKLSPDASHVAYVRENNLYIESLADHRIKALTQDGSETIINGTFDWVYEEELGLRDGFRWSPDGTRIAFWRLDSSEVPVYAIVNFTDSIYPEVNQFRYPKVGQANSTARIGVVDATTGATTWLRLPGRPEFEYIARMGWAANSSQILVQQLDRRQQIKLFSLCDSSSGDCREILRDQDAAWVDTHDDPLWTSDGSGFLWLSERDGFRHLYLVARDSGETTLLTPGEYDVIDLVKLDPRSGRAYFIASPENPTQRYLYEVALDGSGKIRRVSPVDQVGTHRYDIAPKARYAVQTYSSMTRPPIVNLVTLPEHDTIRTLVGNNELRQRLDHLDQPSTEFFRIDIGDQVELDGWCLKPPSFDPAKRYPVLVYVYSEPAGQTVLDRWGGKSLLWHWLVAQRGYVVLSVDNRGTPAPRGRAWRKIVYGQVGVLSSQEQAAAINALTARWRWLDRERMAVWGWSGGGSMTLNMMLRFPGLYAAGMSVAPVADQRLYDTIYQERYMGLLSENEKGYTQGSPITFAHQLEGQLLLIHGSGDDNVHSQNTEVMVNALVKHNKQFSLMIYPNRGHSIREKENTTWHLRQLLTDFLMTHVPPGAWPAVEQDP